MQCAVCGVKTQLSIYTFGDVAKYLCRTNNHIETHSFCSQGYECLPKSDFSIGSQVCRVHSLSNPSYDMMKSLLSTSTTPKQSNTTDPTLATKTSLDSLNTNIANLTTLVSTIKTQHNKLVVKLKDSSVLGISTGITPLNYNDYIIP